MKTDQEAPILKQIFEALVLYDSVEDLQSKLADEADASKKLEARLRELLVPVEGFRPDGPDQPDLLAQLLDSVILTQISYYEHYFEKGYSMAVKSIMEALK